MTEEKIKSRKGLFSPSDIYKTPPSKGDPWREEWEGMPEYIQHNFAPFKSIIIHFRNENDIIEFSKLIKQEISLKRGKVKIALWYPKFEKRILKDKIYEDEKE